MKLEFSRQIFQKYSNTKFNKNPSSGSRTVECGRTNRQIHVTKLTVAFRNFAKAPKNDAQRCCNARYALGRQPTAAAATWPEPQVTTHRAQAWLGLQVSSSTYGRPDLPLVRDAGIKPYSRRLIPTTGEAVCLFSFSSSPVAKISACSKLQPQHISKPRVVGHMRFELVASAANLVLLQYILKSSKGVCANTTTHHTNK